jgi:hypothetical protein
VSGYIILLLILLVGMVILAHEMGRQVGYEHGLNDAERRMSEGYAKIRTSNTNKEGVQE